MLDNGSRDGSAEAARAHPAVDEVIAPGERRGKALNDSELMRRARGVCAAAERGLRAAPRGDARAVAGAAVRALMPPARARSCCGRAATRLGTGQRLPTRLSLPGRVGSPLPTRPPPPRAPPSSRARGAFRRSPRRSPARCLPIGCTPCRARAGRPARWTGASPRRCSCDARRRRRSATWTATSSSTPTRSTSPGVCATPAGAACTCRARGRSTTSSSRQAPCPSAGSSKWRATAISTCASTIARAARAVRWLTAWSYAVRALAALVLPGHVGGRDAHRYWRHVTATLRPGRGEGLREAAADYNRAVGRSARASGAGGAGERRSSPARRLGSVASYFRRLTK